MDRNAIALTHVCRSWREVLIADSSLWTRFDCKNVDKTRVYIERSKSSGLDISLLSYGGGGRLGDAFLLVAPHFSRLRSFSIVGTEDPFRNLTQHISCSAPLLRELTIDLNCVHYPTLNIALFNGDLSSLRTLNLTGVGTRLPWKDLSNLTTFKLHYTPRGQVSITQLLDFFENSSRLRDVSLTRSTADSSDAPSERVVSPPCLEKLTIVADPPAHSILLDHLIIPMQASLTLRSRLGRGEHSLRDFLPKELGNLKNISSISSVNICFDGFERPMRLEGPVGGLFVFGSWGDSPPFVLDYRVFESLDHFTLSRTQGLVVTKFKTSPAGGVEDSPPYLALLRMEALRTLTLIQCNNLPFILALNPDQNPSNDIPCPELEEIVLYVEDRESFNISELVTMTEERALRGMKLPSITIVGLGELLPGREVFELREYVTKVDYKAGKNPPEWDAIPKDEHGR